MGVLNIQNDDDNNCIASTKIQSVKLCDPSHYLCNVCFQVFETKVQFDAHAADCNRSTTVKTSHKRRLACKLCWKRFESCTWLKNHMARKHNMQFECSKCKQMFLSTGSLRKHTCAKDTSNRSKTISKCFGCNKCKIWYSTESEFIKHSNKVHSKVDGFQCGTSSQIPL